MVVDRAGGAALARAGGRYGSRRVNPLALLLALLVQGPLLLLALLYQSAPGGRIERAPLVVELLALPPPPEAPPEEKARPRPPAIVVPVPVVRVSQPSSPVAVAELPPPPDPRPVPPPPEPAPPAPRRPPAPAAGGDLSASMISAVPPRYPLESRRKREQGTVVLSVLLREDGSVAEISVARSSGFPRLDDAALGAVRRWRWSPTVRGGEAVKVRGIVEIPFVLRG